MAPVLLRLALTQASSARRPPICASGCINVTSQCGYLRPLSTLLVRRSTRHVGRDARAVIFPRLRTIEHSGAGSACSRNSGTTSCSPKRSNTSGLLFSTPFQAQQVRCLNLHEYQSMKLMQDYHINTPRFGVASTAKEAEREAAEFFSSEKAADGDSEPVDFVVKAQVLAGGRGLGFFRENGYQGGVQICESPREVGIVAEKMLGKTLVTKQTGKEGKVCNKVLVTERFFIRKERYVAILMDRSVGGPVLIGSGRGGTSIEDIAHKHPESIHKMPIDICEGEVGLSAGRKLQLNRVECKVTITGLLGHVAALHSKSKEHAVNLIYRNVTYEIFLGSTEEKQICDVLRARQLAHKTCRNIPLSMRKADCTQIEVNPLVETHDGRVLVCDAKLNFDDNAEFRQKEIFAMRDISQEDPREVAAGKAGLNYIGLDGSIACMVNGAGLAMATMDIVHLHGGSPANFLDVGGGADQEQIVSALKIIQQDAKAKCVFVNIFGGIMRCDTIAEGLVCAAKNTNFDKPVVLRLEGTNRDAARKVLDKVKTDPAYASLQLLQEDDFNKAAQLVVKVANVVDTVAKTNLKVRISL